MKYPRNSWYLAAWARHDKLDLSETSNDVVKPFILAVPQAELDRLRARLDLVRWPDAETCAGWEQGVPLERAKAFIEYWRTQYNWRRCERC